MGDFKGYDSFQLLWIFGSLRHPWKSQPKHSESTVSRFRVEETVHVIFNLFLLKL